MSKCIECGQHLSYKVVNYSSNNYGVLLCIKHQDWIEYISTITTQESWAWKIKQIRISNFKVKK
ncbi:hypothetical protein C8C84_3014 [Flavobacterium sp. 102]|nr:hypothetical protein C8C84_3014 [Flavobacterium sp. 102]